MSIVAANDLHLDRGEWRAVAVALADAANGACVASGRPTWAARLYGAVTGNRPRAPLADPRLEAVRGFVCAAQRTHHLPEERVPELLGHGFNRRQIEALALLAA